MAPLHISVDFWHTLAEPNPAYVPHRNRILAEAYGTLPHHAAKAYKELKNSWESQAVMSGTVPSLEDIRPQMNAAFGAEIGAQRWADAAMQMAREFRDNPPGVCTFALAALRQLRDQGVTLSVGSNTNFITRGSVLRGLLPPDLFEFQLYSDEIGVCKPNPAFYAEMMLRVGHAGRATRPAEVLHVGDSQLCDVQGAAACGLQTRLCSAEHPLHAVLEEFTQQEVAA